MPQTGPSAGLRQRHSAVCTHHGEGGGAGVLLLHHLPQSDRRVDGSLIVAVDIQLDAGRGLLLVHAQHQRADGVVELQSVH